MWWDFSGELEWEWGIYIITIHYIHAWNHQRMKKIKILNFYLKIPRIDTYLHFQWPWYNLNLCWSLLFVEGPAKVSYPELLTTFNMTKERVCGGRRVFGPGLVCSWYCLTPPTPPPTSPFCTHLSDECLLSDGKNHTLQFYFYNIEGVSKPCRAIFQFLGLKTLRVNWGRQLLLRSLETPRSFNFMTKAEENLTESHLGNV